MVKNNLMSLFVFMILINLTIDIQDGVLDIPVIMAHYFPHLNLHLNNLISYHIVFQETCEIYFTIINTYMLHYDVSLMLVYVLLILEPWKHFFIILKYFAGKLDTKPRNYKFFIIQRTIIKALLSIP